ncbi:MAG: hypothetical protein IIA58_01875 [Candidatus Marinimicrobia bacterium]|nr:hypothetical protein [Candidatus Neomarinimicrobiota bacterium]
MNAFFATINTPKTSLKGKLIKVAVSVPPRTIIADGASRKSLKSPR